MSNFATTTRATMLALRVCSARLDTKLTEEQFAQLVADFREAVEAAAIERAKPDRIADAVRAGAGGTNNDDDSSTGAAARTPTAAHTQAKPTDAASDTPAAPSTEYTAGAVSVVKPPGESLGVKPGQGTEETGTDRPAAPISNKRGPTPVFSAEQKRAIGREYAEACRRNSGKAPYGWLSKKAREHGVAISTMQRTVADGLRAVIGSKGLAREKHDERIDEQAQPGTASRAVKVAIDTMAAREHTHSHACWCRKSTCSTKNPWCPIKKPTKPVGTLAGLQDAPRRVERYLPGRGA